MTVEGMSDKRSCKAYGSVGPTFRAIAR